MTETGSARPSLRLKLAVRGAVQGVGFRPFVFRLATGLDLTGWVNNSPQGVFIEAEGPRSALEQFLLRLETEKPPRSFIQSLEASWLDAVGFKNFEIRASETGGDKTALVMPDIATCPDCLREILDPANRRHRYPFTNCTNCGPRFSIIEGLPYDRANTSMRSFTMCPQCRAEYDNPHDRRFHAQPNACPVCGPQLELWHPAGEAVFGGHQALRAAARAVWRGQIIAVKGLGGFHLIVAAHDEPAVRRLRERKHREEKPFALMFPSLKSVKAVCEVSPLEDRLLRSPEAPIVLLKRLSTLSSQLSTSVAPGNPNLGAMLPYTPLHHLLLAELGFPVVATSGNLSDEPICTDEREALERLRGIADVFLVHNRPIVRHVDDSMLRVMLDRELVLRRARGYAPLPIEVRNAECGMRSTARADQPSPGYGPTGARPTTAPNSELRALNSKTVLAVGAHLKNSVALAVGSQVFISQHIGDLETEPAYAAFRHVIADFEKLYEAVPQIIAADLHPDYLSTKFALERRPPARCEPTTRQDHAGSETGAPHIVRVQHHIAHVLSCMAENEVAPPALGVSWDGTGYGLDGTVWGGEFFVVTDKDVARTAHLRPFRLPGGDQAVKEPRRTALGLLYEAFGGQVFERKDLAPVTAFSGPELATLKTMLAKPLNSPVTTSAGRLFDAVAALVNLRQKIRFEGQAAMELEFAIEGSSCQDAYPLQLVKSAEQSRAGVPPAQRAQQREQRQETTSVSRCSTGAGETPALPPLVLDWSPMIEAILADTKNGIPIATISARFHNGLAEGIVTVARQAGQDRVVLSGGCFQNRYLLERVVRRLQSEGFRPCWHQRVPPNDGGIALGQVIAALRSNG